MESKRPSRVADLIRQEIADLLLKKVKDPRVSAVTITGVEVTPDLQHAKIHFCVMGNPGQEAKEAAQEGLGRARGFIRQELGKRLQLRSVPDLSFRYDTSLEYGDNIERLLRELKKDD